MDSITITAGILGLVGSAAKLFSAARRAQYRSLSRSYGSLAAFLIVFIPLDTAAQHERVEEVILESKDGLVATFKQAVTDECNMTAIAGAIIAQVAITALSLPHLSSTHWVARTLFLLAVISGSLSVYFCCAVQRTIGALYHPESIRDWLSLPPGKNQNGSSIRKASLAAILIISAPYNLMKLSITALLTGLAVYQGFLWTRGLDTEAGRSDSRDVFITYIVGCGACVLSYVATLSLKALESLIYFENDTVGNTTNITLDTRSGTSQIPPATAQSMPSLHPTQSGLDIGGLSAALEAAARAHIECAEAERKVASEYALILEARARNA